MNARSALVADREGELPCNVAVAQPFQGSGHLVPWQLTGELRIDLAGGHQPGEVREVAAEGITTKEQLEDLEADRGIEVDVAYVEGGELVGAVAEHHQRALWVDHHDQAAQRVAAHRLENQIKAA